MGLTSSICLATHNGGPYLGPQLRSLLEQTRLPTELVVVDDASSDGTLAEVEEFAATAPFSVRVIGNATRQGAVGTFERAVEAAAGEIIFLCDQDDLWEPSKVAAFLEVFERCPAASGAFCNSTVFTGVPEESARSMFDLLGFSPAERARCAKGVSVEALLRRNVVSGHALAFRAGLRPMLLPFSRSLYQDAWAALLLAATGPLVVIDEALVLYRRHDSNLVGRRRSLSPSHLRASASAAQGQLLRLARGYEEAADHLESFGGDTYSEPVRQIRAKAEHLAFRACLDHRRPRRVAPISRELRTHRYQRYAQPLRSVLTDLLSPRTTGSAPSAPMLGGATSGVA